MSALQSAKGLVSSFHNALAGPENSLEALRRYLAPDALWRGMHPFHEQCGPDALHNAFWAPLTTALQHLQRRQDMFFAGHNEIDGFDSVWVASMGHYMGLFDAPFLNIPPTRRIAMLRYAEFYRIADGHITEIACFVDIPALMLQAGLQPFASPTGVHLVQPGPMTHDGILVAEQPANTGKATLAAINAMIADLGQWQLGLPLEEELARSWHDDMIWWGPAGIGATYTIPRYAEQHSAPFRAGLKDRSKTAHICRMAEGHFGGFFGWPNFTARPVGGFMGMPASDKAAPFRVVDFYRRRDDKLVENWVFIDLLHFWNSLGVDILTRCTDLQR